MSDVAAASTPKDSLLYDPRARSYLIQAVLVSIVVYVAYAAFTNAVDKMHAHNMPTGLSFWGLTAGFDVNQTLIPFSARSTYGQAFYVGLLNTLLVAGIGVVLTTFVGFFIGILRLSSNVVVSRLAQVYVETLRNIPLLLQLLFWYFLLLNFLSGPRDSLAMPGGLFLNNRGLFIPALVNGDGAGWVGFALLAGIGVAIGLAIYGRARQMRTGQRLPTGWMGLAAVVLLPLLAYLALGRPIGLSFPTLRGFNFTGGLQVFPELVALLLGLTLYTASFIAEIVRAGIQSVTRGQSEAAFALGLRPGTTTKLVVIPQALRVIIPPLTSQYLNLIKNSSLAVFIGYPDLVQVFMGTVLNQTGAAVQCVAITMAVYLLISLVVAWAMNLYNARMALVER